MPPKTTHTAEQVEQELAGSPRIREADPDGLLIGAEAQVPTRRTKEQPPRIERLATSYFQKLWDGTPLKSDETIVKLCLDPLWPMGDLREDINAWRATVALTRTATVFVLDQEDVDMVMESMRTDQLIGQNGIREKSRLEEVTPEDAAADSWSDAVEKTTGAPLMPDASVWREEQDRERKLDDGLNAEAPAVSPESLLAEAAEIRRDPDATEEDLVRATAMVAQANNDSVDSIDRNVATSEPEGTYGLADKQAMYEVEDDPYAVIDLPPLPYPRMAIEVTTLQGLPAAIYASKPAGMGGNHPLMLLNETEAGQVWDVFFPSVEPRGESELWNFRLESGGKFSIPAMALKPDNPHGRVVDPTKVSEQSSPRAARFWRRLTLDLVSLILAENVPHEEVSVPRQHRRAVERKFDPKKQGYRFPTIYWVRLAEAGEKTEGESGRHYGVRWLVRGHWRQYGKGEVIGKGGRKRTYSGKRVWVKPHIKGPVGAPWKGRPVYRGNAVERASDFEAEHVVEEGSE